MTLMNVRILGIVCVLLCLTLGNLFGHYRIAMTAAIVLANVAGYIEGLMRANCD